MGHKTKIDWCDATWNPVTGCKHGCEYCYAQRIAERFRPFDLPHVTEDGVFKNINDLSWPIIKARYDGKETIQPYPYGFEPTFHRYRLDIPKRWTKPRNIFVCSMADLFGEWVPLEWILEVFKACRAAPQHRYLFLTKNQARYASLMQIGKLPTEDNFWYGSTATTPETPFFFCKAVHTFVSIEPIQAPFIDLGDIGSFVDWIIVGAETGNRRTKTVPKYEWIAEIAEKGKIRGTPVFMKESIRELMGADFRQEYPWEV